MKKKFLIALLAAIPVLTLGMTGGSVYAADTSAVISTYRDQLYDYMKSASYEAGACFGLVYLDNDDIPELFITGGSVHSSGLTFYTSDGSTTYEIGNIGSDCGVCEVDAKNSYIRGFEAAAGVVESTYYECTSNGLEVVTDISSRSYNTKYMVDNAAVEQTAYTGAITDAESNHNLAAIGTGTADTYELTADNIEAFFDAHAGNTSAASSDTTTLYSSEQITMVNKPAASADTITTIASGSKVTYISTASDGFYKISYNGNIGYVPSDKLSTKAPDTTADSSTDATVLYVVNCNEWISLRTSPSTSADRITTIPLGAKVTYIATASNGFYQVSYNGSTGYALASYLSTSPASSSSSQTSSTTYMYVVNCNEWISLRTSPSTSADRYTTIPLGAKVTYISSASNGFYKVSYNGYTGYALASYLSTSSSGTTDGDCGDNWKNAMVVVNCEEWISLRSSPSTSASRITTIPLGGIVTYISDASNGFYKVYYNGYTGYALASYLEWY